MSFPRLDRQPGPPSRGRDHCIALGDKGRSTERSHIISRNANHLISSYLLIRSSNAIGEAGDVKYDVTIWRSVRI